MQPTQSPPLLHTKFAPAKYCVYHKRAKNDKEHYGIKMVLDNNVDIDRNMQSKHFEKREGKNSTFRKCTTISKGAIDLIYFP